MPFDRTYFFHLQDFGLFRNSFSPPLHPIIQKITMRVRVPGPSRQQNQARDTKDTLCLATSLLPVLSVCLSVCGCHGSLLSARCSTLQSVCLSLVCSSHKEMLHSAPFKLSFNFCLLMCMYFLSFSNTQTKRCHQYQRNKALRD